MKKALLLTGLLLAVFAVSMLPTSSSSLSAQSGCCKMRRSVDDDWRKALDKTFEECRNLNKERDGDDLFAKRGLVWWDRKCE